MNNLVEYLKTNFIKFNQVSDNVVKIGDQTYQLIYPDSKGRLFDDLFELTCSDTDEDNYIFCFGDKWYFTPKGTETNPQLNPVKYLGEANIEPPFIPWLGIHGKYEILNGSRDYKDWCKKAKFLKTKVLGICELNILAGTLQFQEECKSNDIKPILGATYIISNQDKDIRYRVKIYAKNEQGWQTLLRINKQVNVDNDGFVDEKYFWDNLEEVIIVFDPKYIDIDYLTSNLHFTVFNKDVYYQLDTVQYENQDSDVKYLENLGRFIKSSIQPILIQDSYYLDKEDSYIKGKLNAISGDREFKSKNQHFKSFDEIFSELDQIFSKESEIFERLLERSVKNLNKVIKECDFQIGVKNRFLPKYKMTPEQSNKFKTNQELFDSLIEEGFKIKIPKRKEKEYKERLEREIEVIKYGDVIDYFLILWDIVEWCKYKDILTGIGRGSAGGSLVSYLLNIIKLDPLEFDLLFERFLNKGRVAVSLPDIDTDFEGSRRNEVKRYMEEKYGEFQVCSVGTYTTLKTKAILKDFAKMDGGSIGEIEYINKIINDNSKFTDLFKIASERDQVKRFIKKHSSILNDIDLVFKQPRSGSIHACATLILPKEKSVFEWIPVKKMKLNDGEDALVSEWEGVELEKAGFLKEDILGILQLDKFRFIIDSILNIEYKKIDIFNLLLNDKKVYKYFQNGWNGDIFHFGSPGLTDYCKQLKPENINDLIAAISLYRPGAMENNFHNEYVNRKEGKNDVEYFIGSEEILNKTYGVFVYQEQIMKLCQVLGGLSLIEADDVRKAMVKKKYEELTKYKERFIPYYINNFRVSKEYSEHVWDAIDKASTYLFNKSHATAYAITGYISQYLKVHYPLHYWTCAFSFIPTGKKDEKIPAYISEIHQTGDISMLPPDINKSGDGFTPNFKNYSIYWSLNSVKQCGDKAVEQLVSDKKEKGEYFSFKEFLSRNVHKGSKVTKQVIEHLILSGAFDEIENIHYSKDRNELIKLYRSEYKIKIDKTKDIFELNKESLEFNWWWNLQQKRLCGFAMFDFKLLCDEILETNGEYMDAISIQDRENTNKYITTGGYINEIIVRQSKKGEYADVILDNNFEFITVRFWQDTWDIAKNMLEQKEKCLFLISGKVYYDKWKKHNALQPNEDSDFIILE